MMSTYSRYFSLILLTVFVIIAYGCKTAEETTDDSTVSTDTDTETVTEEVTALQSLLNSSRSQLSDLHISQKHDMPEHFLKAKTGDNTLNSDPSDGFRIQILSTREVEVADSVAGSFRVWSDTTIAGYEPEAHVSFRQPYYKVHIGDFQQREQANSFSKLLKAKFPDAWVVHDRINPENVPADTASFSFKKLKPLNADSLELE